MPNLAHALSHLPLNSAECSKEKIKGFQSHHLKMTEPLSPADEINAERREVFKDSIKINEMIEDEIKVLKQKEDEEGLPQDFRLSDYASDHLKFKVWTLMQKGQSRDVIDHLIDAYCVGYYDGIYDAHLREQ